jgi:hypothetical protein
MFRSNISVQYLVILAVISLFSTFRWGYVSCAFGFMEYTVLALLLKLNEPLVNTLLVCCVALTNSLSTACHLKFIVAVAPVKCLTI